MINYSEHIPSVAARKKVSKEAAAVLLALMWQAEVDYQTGKIDFKTVHELRREVWDNN